MPAETITIQASNNPAQHPLPSLDQQNSGIWRIRFEAMASPCEILLEAPKLSRNAVISLAKKAVEETWRIEEKYSRYRPGNIVHRINGAQGSAIKVDAETQLLLDYAEQCFTLSQGLFDISSGPLRKLWRFQGEASKPPTKAAIQEILECVGWQKVRWQAPYFSLPNGGEIDFGGVVKEYAVDRVAAQLQAQAPRKCFALVNFGGDICCVGSEKKKNPWRVGLESSSEIFQIAQGGLATSGDTYRFLTIEGKKYSHLLNPLTGWPVDHAPQTVTVAAPSCTLAGMLASFAMLQGANAEAYLSEQVVQHYWVQRTSS